MTKEATSIAKNGSALAVRESRIAPHRSRESRGSLDSARRLPILEASKLRCLRSGYMTQRDFDMSKIAVRKPSAPGGDYFLFYLTAAAAVILALVAVGRSLGKAPSKR